MSTAGPATHVPPELPGLGSIVSHEVPVGAASTVTDVPGEHAAIPALDGPPPGLSAIEPGAVATAPHDVAAALPPPDSSFGDGAIGAATSQPDAIANSGGGIDVTQILGTGYTAWKLAIFAALLTSLTRWYGNATGCFNSARLVTFTNVQLIRCGIVSPIIRMASASAATFTQGVGAAATSTRSPVGAQVRRATRTLRHLVSVPKHAVERSLGGGDDGLMIRIGKILGLLYGGFLTVWFWATRLRWNAK
jgi:hypothetical protein